MSILDLCIAFGAPMLCRAGPSYISVSISTDVAPVEPGTSEKADSGESDIPESKKSNLWLIHRGD